MTNRIQLVQAAPSDGKKYIQKDGLWIEQGSASLTSDGLFTKEDKAVLENLKSGSATSDLYIANIAEGNTLHNKLGALITDKNDEPILFGARTPLPESYSDIDNYVHEYGGVRMLNGAWDTKTLRLGGLEFKLTGSSSVYRLVWRRDPKSSAPLVERAGIQTIHKTGAYEAYDSVGGAAQYKQYNLFTRDWIGTDWADAVTYDFSTNVGRSTYTFYDNGTGGGETWTVSVVNWLGNVQINGEYFGKRITKDI